MMTGLNKIIANLNLIGFLNTPEKLPGKENIFQIKIISQVYDDVAPRLQESIFIFNAKKPKLPSKCCHFLNKQNSSIKCRSP